jgi:purine-binding chemotaxis protein CheW
MSRDRLRPDPNRSLVGFTVGNVFYAVPIHAVREIVTPTLITPIPHAPSSIAGMADHRGNVIPIVDLRVRFALPPIEDRTRCKWIRVSVGDKLVGLAVDGVTGVFGTRGAEISPPPVLGDGDELRGLAGVTSYDGRMCFVLDLSRLESLTSAVASTATAREKLR